MQNQRERKREERERERERESERAERRDVEEKRIIFMIRHETE